MNTTTIEIYHDCIQAPVDITTAPTVETEEMKNAADTIYELQHALVEMEKERDALQKERDELEEERDSLDGIIDEYGDPEQLCIDLSEAADNLAKMEKERDDARDGEHDWEIDYSNLEEEVEKLKEQLAAAKPTPPPVAPRKKATTSEQFACGRTITLEDLAKGQMMLADGFAALKTENDRLRTGMHNFNVDRNEADEKIAALEKRLDDWAH